MAGKAIIFSAPSGSGKTTLVRFLLENNKDLEFSVSASTRTQRGTTEKDGKDYYFLSPEQFKNKIDHGDFVEWEEVYEGTYYGTLKAEIQRIWDAGKNVIFDVDVKGGVSLKKYFGEKALSVFVKVPSMEVLAERLKDRGTETEESLARRLQKVSYEMGFEGQFDLVLVNDDLEAAKLKAQQFYDDFKKA